MIIKTYSTKAAAERFVEKTNQEAGCTAAHVYEIGGIYFVESHLETAQA
jgi:hypothetical protein